MTLGSNGDDTTRFSGVIIGHRLQVSPAPGNPTFNDVPTSDFGFQYVEALVASGITGSTGGSNYSPDAFVTRGQMAILFRRHERADVSSVTGFPSQKSGSRRP